MVHRSSSSTYSEPDRHPWYGVRIKTNYERVSRDALIGKGFRPYLPCYKVQRRWSDRTVETVLPLFPGYLFCQFDARNPLPILTSAGVLSLVGFGQVATPINDLEIEAVQRILASGIAVSPSAFLNEGQWVRVTKGPLRSVEGIVVRKKSDWRLVVSLNLLRRSLAVEVESDWLTAI